jgi:GNAT superfamily N-acetyltransferase
MEIIRTKYLTGIQIESINRLWNEEYPINLKDKFINLLDGVENFNHYLIEDDDKNMLAWAVDFEKDFETRFSLIVKNKEQGKGLGKLLVAMLKENLNEFYGWVIDHNNDKKENGDFYRSPLPFYIKQGFEVLNNERIENEILKAVKVKHTIQS